MAVGMALGQDGAAVAVVGRTLERAEAAAARIAAAGAPAVHAASCDARKPEQVAAAFDESEASLGPITSLANNVGTNFPGLTESISVNTWHAVTRIAVDGTFLCSAEFVRRLIRRGDEGAIVNNSAQYIWTGFPADAHSAAAKTAVATMTCATAREWTRFGIRVNAVAVGFFPHERMIVPEDEVPTLDAMMPAGRTGRVREYGWLSALACSQLLPELTGQVFIQDGGECLRRWLMAPEFISPRERADGPWGWK